MATTTRTLSVVPLIVALGIIAEVARAAGAVAPTALAYQSLNVQPNALLSVDENRRMVVDRIVGDFGEAVTNADLGVTPAQLRAVLMSMRADRLLAASLAGNLEGLLGVIAAAESSAKAQSERVRTKALGDPGKDVVYTPVTPCRIVDTRYGAGGTLLPLQTRNWIAANPGGTFSSQGGAGTDCGIPIKPAGVMVNVTVFNTGLGPAFLTAWPFNQPRPNASLVNWTARSEQVANAVGIPLCASDCAADFSIYASSQTDVVLDVLGYFAAPSAPLPVTQVTAGIGLSGGGTSGNLTLDIAPGGVGTAQLASNAVDTTKIKAGAVGTPQLADNAVTSAKVSDGSITRAKLAAAGGGAGQLLSTDGVNLQWTTSPATLTPVNPLGNTLTTVDSAADVGQYSAIAVGADGLPVISYVDVTNGTLKVARCGNGACTGASTLTTLDSACNSSYYGAYTSIAIGVDGAPVISYAGTGSGPGACSLKVAKCGNALCTGASTITTLQSGGGGNATGLYSSITLGADGLPVISFHSGGVGSPGPGSLLVAKCGDAACTTTTAITNVDGAVSMYGVGLYTSITLGADGLPVMSYQDADGGRMKVAKCGNGACTSGNSVSIVDGGSFGYTSIALGADGLPVISYFDYTNGHLKVAKCVNAACTGSSTLTTVDGGAGVGYLTSIALGPDGLPVISYYDNTNHDLKVAKCANAACTGTGTTVTVDSGGDVGWFDSITLGADRLPVISYYDNTNHVLKVLKCSSATCMPYVRNR